ncbi:MAG: hypothetical protein WAL09_09490, partial [Pseudolabrys sp.]
PGGVSKVGDRKLAPGRPLPDGLSCMVKVVLVPPPEISLYQVLKCPECKSTTVLIEKIEGSETHITLKLELPPGADPPLLA